METQGRLGHLTPEQEQKLQEFKQKQSGYDDDTLLRFLRARNFDLALTSKMFDEYVEWRQREGIDTILDDFVFPEYELVRQNYPRFYFKTDKFGRPVYIERLGHVKFDKLQTVTTSERMVRYHVYEYEKLIRYRFKACSVKSARTIEQSTTILDLTGVYLSTFSSVFGLIRQISGIAQNYYPELLGKMFIVNAPMLFSAIWALVSPLLNEVTVRKISIVGSSYKEKLLEFIDADSLPDFLGGTCTSDKWEQMDYGPWNDGSVDGYPIEKYEKGPLKAQE
jgi:hypothetical protein